MLSLNQRIFIHIVQYSFEESRTVSEEANQLSAYQNGSWRLSLFKQRDSCYQ